MKREDVRIGDRFTCNRAVWRVTDIGTRTVIAISDKAGWRSGPPFGVAEMVFDEFDLEVCDFLTSTSTLSTPD